MFLLLYRLKDSIGCWYVSLFCMYMYSSKVLSIIVTPCYAMILDQLKDMFTVKYSPAGSSSHKLEVDAFAMFMDYLYECEKGNNNNFM